MKGRPVPSMRTSTSSRPDAMNFVVPGENLHISVSAQGKRVVCERQNEAQWLMLYANSTYVHVHMHTHAHTDTCPNTRAKARAPQKVHESPHTTATHCRLASPLDKKARDLFFNRRLSAKSFAFNVPRRLRYLARQLNVSKR